MCVMAHLDLYDSSDNFAVTQLFGGAAECE